MIFSVHEKNWMLSVLATYEWFFLIEYLYLILSLYTIIVMNRSAVQLRRKNKFFLNFNTLYFYTFLAVPK